MTNVGSLFCLNVPEVKVPVNGVLNVVVIFDRDGCDGAGGFKFRSEEN